LGERESGTERLEDAVAAYELALKERTRERLPLDWASVQNNLGNVLRVLGERGSGTERLEEAVAAYESALKERSRDRVPLDYAMTQDNLGTALRILGERRSGTGRLQEARRAIGLAWDVYREAAVDRYDTWFETRLKLVDDLIKSRRTSS
jgi:tetratricopeptide (TPR) repeat protein